MMTTKTLCFFLAFAPITILSQCSWTIRVEPLNLWEDVFTYEVDQIFDGNCYQAAEPGRSDQFSMLDMVAGESTYVIKVTDNGKMIDKFVINPIPLNDSCKTWMPSDTTGAYSRLVIEPSRL